MKLIKRHVFLLFFVFLSFTSAHKFYVSITQIDFIQDQKAVQITARIFTDDLEKLLRERYEENITLNVLDDEAQIDMYITKYIKQKIQLKINGEMREFTFLGKEYENDIMYCYFEILNVNSIDEFEIKNQLLFDVFKEQENIIKTKINGQHKSFILTRQNDNRTFLYQ